MRRAQVSFLAAFVLVGCSRDAPTAPNRVPPDEEGKADGMTDRSTWVVRQIRRWNADLDDEARAEKYQAMAASPFAFFRGTNHLFWADHVRDARLGRYGGADTGTFLAGDVHPENFGAYDMEGRLVYGLNDVDDAIPGEAQLDVWRLAAGLTIVAEGARLDGSAVVDAMVGAYLETMRAGGEGGDPSASGRLKDFLATTARKESRAELLEKWTVVAEGQRRLNTGLDKLVPADPGAEAELREALFWHEVKGVGGRLHAGLASLGQARYYVLVEGPSDAPDDDVLLDVKRQPAPTGYAFIGWRGRAAYDAVFENHADRAVWAGLALRGADDDAEGWLALTEGVFTVRPLSPWKKSLDLDDLDRQDALEEVARAWGVILATDQIRAAAPAALDAAVTELAGEGEGYRRLVLEIAAEDALQVAADYQTFLDEIR